MTLEAYDCPDCKGSGNDPTEPWRVCTWCHGNKVMYRTVTPPHDPPPDTDEPPGHDLEDTPNE